MMNRASFPRISPAAWEHPADRAALSAFAAIPGASELVRRVVGSTTERSLRLSYLGGAARVSAAQFPAVHRLVREAARILDLEPAPEAYVKLDLAPGAFTFGVEKPFIVLTSGALEFWDEEELLSVIGHELGHILSGHAVYKTLLGLVATAQSALGGDSLLASAAMLGMVTALREWDRKSELTADRAGLIVCQDPQPVYRALMKSAGGPRVSEMDLNEFFRQAAEYDAAAEGLDTVLKFLDVAGDSHPFPAVRMVALQEWEKGGAWDALRRGEYPKRDEGGEADPIADFEKARASYQDEFASSQDPLSQAAGKVLHGIGEIFGNLKDGVGGQGPFPGGQSPFGNFQNPFGPDGPLGGLFGGGSPFGGEGPFGSAGGNRGEPGPDQDGQSGGSQGGQGSRPKTVEELFDEIFRKKQ